ncbi:MAG: membrane protein insertase YidC [Mucilaginibacter polytrichastri]|nr:membrane protein insertase YidC [Mucilaginibacter polytrichastri]
MDRNTFTGLFLILVILVGSFFFLKPSNDEIKAEKQRVHQDSLRKAGKAPAVEQKAAAPEIKVDSARFKGPFGSALTGSESFVTLENEQMIVKISTKGGRVYSVQLKSYKTFDGKPLILFEGEKNRFGFRFNAGGQAVNTNELFFTADKQGLSVKGTDSASVTLRLPYGNGKSVDYVYSLRGNDFNLGYQVVMNNMADVIPAKDSKITLDWASSLRKQEKDLKIEREFSTAYYKYVDEKPQALSTTKDETEALNEKKLTWVSFKQHFFTNVLIAPQGFDRGNVSVLSNINSPDIKEFKAQLDLTYNHRPVESYKLGFFFGPNQFQTLKKQGYDIEKQIELGWGPLQYINRWAVIPLFNFLERFNLNYGIIILLLTVVLKLVLFPLTYKSYQSMAKMRVLKPEMDEIKAKVGEDNPTLLQQEYMKLYKKAGVNPLGGCLPLVLQMPIIIAFFRFFPSAFELRQQSFLWMHDLSIYDAVINFGFEIPFLGNHLSLMCVLMTISTLIYTYFNNQISGATGQMKYIGYITPIIFLGVLNSYASGLNYYYFCANILTFTQQGLIRRFVDDKKIHAQIQENKKKPETEKKKSGFQKRMEDYMRQQQQIQQKKK